ncbi:DUF3566 domain-containing protein [Corynebacterium caspium]|uniref:DUF3566 domain-containing protein n=1 Tax=Corynebacterium caspium TaxID=234828 RepID=UPI00035F1DA0|nr:DUF3566 domain-containing protein [Corynebacterium caspium]WKD58451.1 hypothetical protein CCASP_00060 [Corynebacterium caspium DSM 44850]
MAREVEITKVAPLAAFRVALALSLVGLVAWIICVALLYLVMQAAGVWDTVNSIISGFGGGQTVTFGLVISLAALGGALFAIATSLLAPLTALIYNAVVELFGGIRISLADTRTPATTKRRPY